MVNTSVRHLLPWSGFHGQHSDNSDMSKQPLGMCGQSCLSYVLWGYGGGGGGGPNRLQAPVCDGVGVEETVPCLAAGTCSLFEKGEFFGGDVGGGGVIIVCSGLISDIIQYCLCSP